MIPKIKKILYATDLSANSAYAFRYAMQSAINNDALIVILHVLEEMPQYVRIRMESYLDDEQRQKMMSEKDIVTKNRVKERLQIFCDKELKNAPECIDRVLSTEVVEGYPADEILRKAEELDCDIIIMGTHSKGMMGHAFLGSVAEKVLRRIRKPVFIVPLPRGDTEITFHDV